MDVSHARLPWPASHLVRGRSCAADGGYGHEPESGEPGDQGRAESPRKSAARSTTSSLAESSYCQQGRRAPSRSSTSPARCLPTDPSRSRWRRSSRSLSSWVGESDALRGGHPRVAGAGPEALTDFTDRRARVWNRTLDANGYEARAVGGETAPDLAARAGFPMISSRPRSEI